MDGNTKPTSNKWRAIDWLKSGATYGLHIIQRFMISMCSALTSALACFVLLLVIAPDIVSFRRRQSKTPNPTTRKLPTPVRSGGEIFAIMPDGSRVKVEPLAAVTHARAWNDVCFGGYVHERTKLPD